MNKPKYIFELMNGAEYVSDDVLIVFSNTTGFVGSGPGQAVIDEAFTADVVRIVTKVGGNVVRFRGSEIRTITEG